MKHKHPGRVLRIRPSRPRRAHDEYEDDPADVIPFGPRAPRTPLESPTSAQVVGGRLTKRRTWTPGLSMTLAIDVEALAHALATIEKPHATPRRMTHDRFSAADMASAGSENAIT